MLAKSLKIIALPLFHDNYSYIVLGTAFKKLVLVDPANPNVVIDYLNKYLPSHQVNYILYTHKHWDHAGGSEDLIKLINNPGLTVVAGKQDGQSIKGSTLLIGQDSDLDVNNVKVKVYQVPCHTRGHLLYHFNLGQTFEINQDLELNPQKTFSSENKQVYQFHSKEFMFTGDTLFCGGVGKFFQGNNVHMHKNLKKIYYLNPSIHLFNGHQYTKDNLNWARKVEYQNKQLLEYYEAIENKACTLPSTIALQKKINVFLRSVEPSENLKQIHSDPEELLRILREMKNEKKTLVNDPKI